MITYTGISGDIRNVVVCDLRSDTVTCPDAAMRAAMAQAEVGDDVYGEDTSILALESRMAGLLGKEAAVFMPTGTQSNLCAIMAHCGRSDQLIVGNTYHIFVDEAAGASVLAGVSMHAVAVDNIGAVSPETVRGAIQDDDFHSAISRLLCLENTAAGQVIPLDQMQAAAHVAWDAGLSVHLDGAQFFNAITALGCEAKELAACADSISVCFSKGLGAPSVLYWLDHPQSLPKPDAIAKSWAEVCAKLVFWPLPPVMRWIIIFQKCPQITIGQPR